MALAVKIQFFSGPKMRPTLEIEPDWWDIGQLLDEYPFTFIGDWTFRDYEIYLSGEEFIDLHLDMLSYTEKGTFQFDAWQPTISKKRKKIEEAISEISRYPRIRVHVFEYGN